MWLTKGISESLLLVKMVICSLAQFLSNAKSWDFNLVHLQMLGITCTEKQLTSYAVAFIIKISKSLIFHLYAKNNHKFCGVEQSNEGFSQAFVNTAY